MNAPWARLRETKCRAAGEGLGAYWVLPADVASGRDTDLPFVGWLVGKPTTRACKVTLGITAVNSSKVAIYLQLKLQPGFACFRLRRHYKQVRSPEVAATAGLLVSA